LDSPTKKEPKTMPSGKKIMRTVFWDTEGCILIEFLERGKTVNADHYVQKLLMLRHALRDKRPGSNVILQHDTARPHIGFCEQSDEWTTLRHERGTPDRCALRFSGSWFIVQPQGNIQNFRTVENMCTEKRRLCRK
jgi:extradiol dioxygenase family protein